VRVVITAGGTGGHIYPALAIADKIKSKEPKSEILYIGTHNRMEKEIVPERGYRYESIKVYGFGKNMIFRNIINVGLIAKAQKRCTQLMRDFKPDVVVGVGGYVTYPVIKAANKLGIKTFIHEQNSIPGKSNRWLGKKVDKIGVTFADTIEYFDESKCILTGHPCAENALDVKPIPKTKYGLDRKKQSVLIVQGSMGSETMNQKMLDFLSSIEKESYDVLYVTGKSTYDNFIKNKFSKNVHIVPYIDGLSGLMKDIDLMVTRCGAATITEAMALKIPCVYIPSPFVANNHQYHNAISLKNAKAGEMLEEKDLTSDLLKKTINKILSNPRYYQEIQANLGKMSINDSSTKIYEVLKELTKR